ncbi:endo alpha-1,4 polygalactosaminidase [Mycolicibacterium komossense]|uniref:Endo alpha-1,4 polygalactosaminidase n=1 Tax=Mycolicibacterium komossense TaxID=1779 RepID=A0ABT3CJ07_9MYCO|nr:endo alpha-1,4 polygalactosaminidase [Mycolicibacterium komossense]MCV7229432.1 endo alpha-1,4 polygalactosaminidase [Mycolicibacterium komossense]
MAIAGCGTTSAAPVALPPVDGVPDYQLGAAYPPPAQVTVVARDRTAQAPAAGRYGICYVNGFQTQPGELGTWPQSALLRKSDGSLVYDPDWPDEVLLDTRTPEQRATIVGTVSDWIKECVGSGYNAVEFDNIDSYNRTGGVLNRDDAVALARDLVAVAHAAGLAAAQKNAAEDSSTLRTAGFDFAVAEECAAYGECSGYTGVYGNHVVDIEYTDNLPRPFATMCADPATPRSVVLRDRDLVAPTAPGYHFQTCP